MTPIDWETIWLQLDDAYDAYGRKLKGRQTWVDVLFEYDYEVVAEAIKVFVKYSGHPPRPNQILKEVKSALQNSVVQFTVEGKKCEPFTVAPQIVKEAYCLWINHLMGGPLLGEKTSKPTNKELEDAMRVVKKSAISVGKLHMLHPDIQNLT